MGKNSTKEEALKKSEAAQGKNQAQKPIQKHKAGVKPLILVACAVVVGLSVYADWSYNKNKSQEGGGFIYNSAIFGEKTKILGEATYVGTVEEQAEASEQESYFAMATAERQKSREDSLQLLQTVVDSVDSMPDAKNKALEDMTRIADAMESEANIETLVKAKGFEDCVCVIGSDDVNVIVKSAGLLTYQVAQIREIVMNEVDVPLEKVKIIEKNQ